MGNRRHGDNPWSRSFQLEKHMNRTGILAVAVFALASIAMNDAFAARIGGGKSLGAQRPSVTPKASAPAATPPPAAASQPVMPPPPKPAMPAAATPAPSGVSRWLGPIAGIAAGLGLAALLSHFGLPEGMGTFLLLALLGIGIVFAVRMLFARRAPAREPLAYAPPGAGASPVFQKS